MHYDDAGSYLSQAVYSTLADGSIDRQSTWANGDFEQHKYSVLDDGALSQTIAGDDGEIFKVTITSYDADNTETEIVNYRTDYRTDVGTYVDGVEMEYIETFTADDGTGNKKGDVVTYSFDPDSLETTQIFVNADGTSQVYSVDADANGKADFDTSVRLGAGTHSTANGTLTLDLTLDAGGRLTRATDDSGKETFTEYDSSNNVIEVEENYVDNDGALVTKITAGSVSTEEIKNEDGSSTVREVNTATGAISVTEVDAQGAETVKSANATIDTTANTATFDITVGPNTVTKTINLLNGNESDVVKDADGNILSTTTVTEDASGNEVILEILADGAKTETVISQTGDSQVTATTASGDVTVSEIAKLADGSSATKILGTGTVSEANGNSVLTLELVDGSSLTETTNISTGAVSAETEDEFGNVRTEDAGGNVTFADAGGAVIEATDFTSELDLDYDGAGSDAAFDAGEKFVFDFTAGTMMSDENYDPNHGNEDDDDDDSATQVSSGRPTYNAGINAVRPEYNLDDDIPMSYDIA
jgi:YD repeat-containing protein